MDICVEGDLIGRIVFELYKDLCPKTCANFVALCTGEKGKSSNGTQLSYVNSIMHRVVPNGWIQGGGNQSNIYAAFFKQSTVCHCMCIRTMYNLA